MISADQIKTIQYFDQDINYKTNNALKMIPANVEYVPLEQFEHVLESVAPVTK